MGRPPITGTRWFALSGRELLVLAAGVGLALLAVGLTQVLGMVRSRGRITVSEPGGVVQMPTRLNINTAMDYELTMLPGIGPAKARAILQYREEHGPFSTLEEMVKVRGIGPEILEAIRPHAMCAPGGKAPDD